MPVRLALLALASGSALSGAAMAAQRTWTVDAAAGPGADFVDLPPALAAAGHGDVIWVRRGTYHGATTDRGVTLLGEDVSLSSPLRITGLPLARTFAAVGLRSSDVAGAHGVLECRDNAGSIHLDRLVLATPTPTVSGVIGPACRFERCRVVRVTSSSFTGSPGLCLESSRVTLSNSIVRGHDGYLQLQTAVGGAPGVTADFAAIDFAHCRIQGGAGLSGARGSGAPAPGVNARECDLWFGGTSPDGCRAGAAVAYFSTPGLLLSGGVLTLDPTYVIAGSGGAPAIGGQPRVRVDRRVPVLRAAGGAPGGILASDLYAPPGALVAQWVGVPVDPLPTPFGELCLDAGRLLLVDVAVVDAGQHRYLGLRVPARADLLGSALALQSVGFDPASSRVALSNAVVVLVW